MRIPGLIWLGLAGAVIVAAGALLIGELTPTAGPNNPIEPIVISTAGKVSDTPTAKPTSQPTATSTTPSPAKATKNPTPQPTQVKPSPKPVDDDDDDDHDDDDDGDDLEKDDSDTDDSER